MPRTVKDARSARCPAWLAAALTGTLACAHDTRSAHTDGDGGDLSSDDASASTAQALDAGAGDASVVVMAERFGVALSSDKPLPLCPGSCVNLTAHARDGVPPYQYTFEPPIGAGPGPHRVCPEQTTTYRVSVSDSSSSGEFGGRNDPAMQSLTLRVSDPCTLPEPSDAAVSMAVDASADTGSGNAAPDAAADATSATPEPPTSVLCNVAIARVDASRDDNSYVDFWNDDFANKVAVARDGRVVVAATYVGSVQLWNGTTLVSGGQAIVVAELDDNCKPLWYANLRGFRTAHEPTVAIDSRGRVVVLGSTQSEQPVSGATSAIYLASLAADGAVAWEKRIESLPGTQWQKALRLDANDDIIVMTTAAPGSNFGGAAMGSVGAVGQDPTVTVLAKYRSSGAHVWSRLLQEAPTRASLAIQTGTSVIFHGWSDQARDWGAAGKTAGAGASRAHGYLVRANADGNFVWSRTVSEGEAEQFSWHWLDVTASDELVLSNWAASGQLRKANANGDVIWSKVVVDPVIGLGDDWNKTSVDAQGNVLVGGNFHRTTSINGATLDAGALGGEDAFVQLLDANGQVRWTFQTHTINPDPADGEWLLGAAAGPSGEVFALLNMATAAGSSLQLLKLAHRTGP